MNPDQWQTYLVTQASLSKGRSTTDIVEAAIEGGVDVVQLREKGLDIGTRYELGRELRDLTTEAGVDLIVNDRVDLAHAIGADGVHLGQSDLPVSGLRISPRQSRYRSLPSAASPPTTPRRPLRLVRTQWPSSARSPALTIPQRLPANSARPSTERRSKPKP